MQNKPIKRLSCECINLLCVLCVTFSVLPGYLLLGNLPAQIFACFSTICIFILVFDLLFKVKTVVFSYSLIFMTVFWVIVAIIKQLILQFNNKGLSFNWFHLFYYDRPAMLFIVQFTCIGYFIIKLIKNQNDSDFINSYKKFIKNSTVCFIIYYIIILIYCFILVREITFISQTPNLKPFATIITTFSLGRIDYELLFLFLGNIAIFFPLGIFTSAINKNKVFLTFFPIFLSVSIELSQYFLGNGHPDVDDVILNVFGFYSGWILNKIINIILFKVSDGRLKSLFIF